MANDDVDDELPRIVDELLQRLRRGERVNWPACFRRHPRHAPELRRLATTMEALVKVLLKQAG